MLCFENIFSLFVFVSRFVVPDAAPAEKSGIKSPDGTGRGTDKSVMKIFVTALTYTIHHIYIYIYVCIYLLPHHAFKICEARRETSV